MHCISRASMIYSEYSTHTQTEYSDECTNSQQQADSEGRPQYRIASSQSQRDSSQESRDTRASAMLNEIIENTNTYIDPTRPKSRDVRACVCCVNYKIIGIGPTIHSVKSETRKHTYTHPPRHGRSRSTSHLLN